MIVRLNNISGWLSSPSTVMMGARPNLAPFYYLEHFEEMLSFLLENCSSLMGDMELCFCRDFKDLPHEAKALVVRLANRRSSLIRISSLKYKEMGVPQATR